MNRATSTLIALALLSASAGCIQRSEALTPCPVRRAASNAVTAADEQTAPDAQNANKQDSEDESPLAGSCPSEEDAQAAVESLQQLASTYEVIVRDSNAEEGATKLKKQTKLSSWKADLGVWQNQNNERLSACDLLRNAHGETEIPRIPTTLENLKIAAVGSSNQQNICFRVKSNLQMRI